MSSTISAHSAFEATYGKSGNYSLFLPLTTQIESFRIRLESQRPALYPSLLRRRKESCLIPNRNNPLLKRYDLSSLAAFPATRKMLLKNAVLLSSYSILLPASALSNVKRGLARDITLPMPKAPWLSKGLLRTIRGCVSGASVYSTRTNLMLR